MSLPPNTPLSRFGRECVAVVALGKLITTVKADKELAVAGREVAACPTGRLDDTIFPATRRYASGKTGLRKPAPHLVAALIDLLEVLEVDQPAVRGARGEARLDDGDAELYERMSGWS